MRALPAQRARARATSCPASSTAEAVRKWWRAPAHGLAALGTRLAADIYGAHGHARGRGGPRRQRDALRLARARRTDPGARRPPLRASERRREWKTSLVFWGAGADSPGWLVRCLDELARREINLTKIESRPRRDRLGHYMFFVDLEGSLPAEPGVTGAVAGCARCCEEVRVLGSYPARPDGSTGPGRSTTLRHADGYHRSTDAQ